LDYDRKLSQGLGLANWLYCGVYRVGVGDTMSEQKPKDLKTTITVIQLILKALEWWKEYRDKRKAARDVG
jgi:hypothetical protein